MLPGKSHHSPSVQQDGITAWYFGWNIVVVASVLMLLAVGLRLGIGPFFFPISDSLGLSRSLLSTIVAITMLFYGLAMPFAGWLVVRIGTRNTLHLGTLMIVVGGSWAACAETPFGFSISFGVILSVGLAFVSPVTLTPIVNRWFTHHRGMALFFLSTGGMAGLAVVTPLLTWTIDIFGWRATLAGYTAVLAVLTILGALFVMHDEAPVDADQSAGVDKRAADQTALPGSLRFRDALVTSPFWKLTLGLIANGYSMTLLGTHGIPMLIDNKFDASTSSLGVGLIGLVAIFSTIALGRIADAVSRKNMLAVIFFVRGLAFMGLVLVVTKWQLYTVAIVGGLVWAGAIALVSAIMADIYGARLLGSLYGISFSCQQLGGMVSAWLGGWGNENFGTHWIAFGSAAAILFVAGFVSVSLPRQGMGGVSHDSVR